MVWFTGLRLKHDLDRRVYAGVGQHHVDEYENYGWVLFAWIGVEREGDCLGLLSSREGGVYACPVCEGFVQLRGEAALLMGYCILTFHQWKKHFLYSLFILLYNVIWASLACFQSVHKSSVMKMLSWSVDLSLCACLITEKRYCLSADVAMIGRLLRGFGEYSPGLKAFVTMTLLSMLLMIHLTFSINWL